MPTTPVVIDCDPGIDDVVALALAAKSSEIDLRAVTTTYGNAELPKTTRNARTLLGLAGQGDIIVAAGAQKPLQRPLETAPETHGPSGVGYAAVPFVAPVAGDPLALLKVLEAQPDRVTLVTLGPLTNLAHAITERADVVEQKIARYIGMFGNINERGNTNRWADFNAWCDPEAVAVVLQAGLPVEMVGLDVTRQMTLSAEEVQRLRHSPAPEVAWLGAALQFYVEFHRAQERLDGCVVNDPLPLGEIIHPGMLGFRPLELVVDLDENEHRGHTVVRPGGSLTSVALEFANHIMRKQLDRVFGSTWREGQPA